MVSVGETFEGVVINFKSNKKIKGQTIVSSKKDFNTENKSYGLIPAAVCIIVVFCAISIPLIKFSFEQWTIYGIHDYTFLPFSLVLFFGLILLLSTIFKNIKKSKELIKSNLEDIDFDKRFNVQATDEIEARYLLTPSFMERLKNVQTSFGTNKIKCSFHDEDITFAISTKKDLFEIGDFYNPVNNTAKLEIFFSELTSIILMIDYFKLDEKTGL